MQGVRPVGITGMQDSMDQIAEALTALIEGRAPKGGVRPLSGIREAYLLPVRRLRDDRPVPCRPGATWPTSSSTTMANIVANVLNKVVVTEFQTYPRWWEPIVLRDNFNTLQTIKWITLGGVGELPVVSEGAAYSELTWDDAAEDRRLAEARRLPRHHARSDGQGRRRPAAQRAARAGAGRLADARQDDLGHLHVGVRRRAEHGGRRRPVPRRPRQPRRDGPVERDLGAAKLAMRKQTELNSGERLGGLTSPRYLLVPPDLENTALTVLASEGLPGTANNDVNPDAEGNTPRRPHCGRAPAHHRGRPVDGHEQLGGGGGSPAVPDDRARVPLRGDARDLLGGQPVRPA